MKQKASFYLWDGRACRSEIMLSNNKLEKPGELLPLENECMCMPGGGGEQKELLPQQQPRRKSPARRCTIT